MNRYEEGWVRRVDAAFDAHAVDGTLTLTRFVEACRALSTGGAGGGALSDAKVELLDLGGERGGEPQASGELRRLLGAAWFLRFDDDASGDVHRDRDSLSISATFTYDGAHFPHRWTEMSSVRTSGC
jgi:hypothetical protein